MDLNSLCEYYYPLVYGYLLSLTGGDRDTAKELTQETFLQALRSINQFRGDAKVSTWLCGIGKNLYYKHLRRFSKYREVPLEEAVSAACRENLEARLIQDEQLRQIADCIERMNEPMAQVVRYRLYGEMSYPEIAELTGHTENWARVMYCRARKQIEMEMSANED